MFIETMAWRISIASSFLRLKSSTNNKEERLIFLMARVPNEEIYKLVWEHNPYVLDVKEGEWNAGDLLTLTRL